MLRCRSPGCRPIQYIVRQMADRVRRVGVLDQLGLGGRPGGEVEEQRLVGQGATPDQRFATLGDAVGVGKPTLGLANAQPHQIGRVRAELRRVVGAGDDGVDRAAVEPVAHVRCRQQGGRWDHHRAHPDAGQHRYPKRRAVAEQQQHAIPALDTRFAEEAGKSLGLGREFIERQRRLSAILLDHPQRGRVGWVWRQDIEPVSRVVELTEVRPAEIAVGHFVVLAMSQQEVTGCTEGERCRTLRADGHPRSLVTVG